MPSTYSNSLRLELQADNENQGNWGSITNRNLGTLLESSISGVRSITLPDTDYTLTALNGSDDEARYAYLIFNGTLTATRNVVVPTPSKLYAVRNATNQSIVIKTATGTGVTIPSGRSTLVYSNGVNVLDRADYLSSLTVGGSTVISTSSTSPALRITQTGTGEALRVEDETNPDATPFVIDAVGNVGVGTGVPSFRLDAVSSGNTQVARFRTGGDATTDIASFERNDSAVRAAINYNGSDGGITLWTTSNHLLALGTNGTRRAVIDTSGNLGLGVTPSAWGAGQKYLEVGNGGAAIGSGGNGTGFFRVNNFFNGTSDIYKTSLPAGAYGFNNGWVWFTAPSGTAGATINFTQAMTLTSGGNLLVGTTVDNGGRVRAVGNGTIADFTNNADANFLIREVSGTITVGPSAPANLAFQTGSAERARITAAGYFKASNTGTYAAPGGAFHESNNNQNTVVHLFQSSSTGSAVEVVNTNLPSGATGFHFASNLGATRAYQVLANGNVQNTNNSYGAISDIKLKENITDATPKLDDLMRVRVRHYNFKSTPQEKQIGVVAQELEQIFPGMVEESPDRDEEGNDLGTTTKAVKYSVFVPMLVKAIQEQQAMIAALESRLAALEQR